METISIIIPAYNKGNNLHFPLQSLLEQTISNFEVIIIDDGSTDNTKNIIKKYIEKDSRFKYYFQFNAGVSNARNKGIELAQGEYICFLDADDYYDKTFLEKLYTEIKVSNSEICYCGYNIETTNEKYSKKTRFIEKPFLLEYILGTALVSTNSWMIKKCLIDTYNIAFPEGVSWGEDFEFFCEILSRVKTVSAVKEYLTNYRVNFDENQLSNFSLDKLDKEYESIMRLKQNKIINQNKNIEKALIDYRLPARLTYRLIKAIEIGEEKQNVLKYIDKYKQNILTFKILKNNKLRSLKVNIYKIKLLIYMKK